MVGSSCFSPMPSMFVCLTGAVVVSLLLCDGDFVEPARRFEQFAGAGAIGGAYQAVAFHQVDEVRGSTIANSKATLEERCRGFAKFKNQTYCVIEHGIVVVAVVAGAFHALFVVARRLK